MRRPKRRRSFPPPLLGAISPLVRVAPTREIGDWFPFVGNADPVPAGVFFDCDRARQSIGPNFVWDQPIDAPVFRHSAPVPPVEYESRATAVDVTVAQAVK